jgi:2-polyprenyl-6-hydroxyphenyl methylase/3-demethylubiquinone-9 3-methyltransferase
MEMTKEKLDELHLNIPGDYYDYSMEFNPVKKYFHEIRFQVITNMVANAKGKLLDIGCAGGTFTNELSRNTDAKITAIDISPQAIEYARERYPHIDFQVHDASFNLPFADHSFDTVTMLETLEHVLNPVEILQDIKRVLKPKGEIIVLVPSENWYFQLGWAIWTKLPLGLGGNSWEEVHVQRFDGDKLRHLMEFIGYEVIEEKRPALGLLVAIRAQIKDININL